MTLFDYFINYIEGFILSFFVSNYFNIKHKRLFIVIVSIICFLEITISNSINVFSQSLIYLLILTLFISLWIVNNKVGLEEIIISSVAGLLLIACNLVSLSFTSIIFHVNSSDIYASQSLLTFAIIISKLIFVFSSIFICIFKIKTFDKLPLRNWWIMIVLGLSIVFILAILMEILLTGLFTQNMAIIMIVSLLVISLLFLFVFRKIQADNDEKLKYALEAQKNSFNKENFDKMKIMSNQIIDTEHRMTYILMQIKNLIQNKEYSKAELVTEEYIKKVKKIGSIINTNNPYFDFVIGRKISDFAFEDIYLKNTLFIFENDIYNDKRFCDLIISILDMYRERLNEKKELSLGIYQETNFVVIEVIGKLDVPELKINDYILDLIEEHKADYSLKKIGSIYTIKVIIEI